MVSVAPIEMRANVRNPAICPLRRRSRPMIAPSTRLNTNLAMAPTALTSGLLMSFRIFSSIITVVSIQFYRKDNFFLLLLWQNQKRMS